MNELLNKLSSYNLFNYLFPGIIFAFVADRITGYHFVQHNLVYGLFLYYFIGLVVSRFGSLILEPILKGLKFLRFAEYKDFVAACKQDDKLEVLSEVNNTYRTLCSLSLLLPLLRLYELLENSVLFLKEWRGILILATLFFLFLFSFKKQTDYIVKRIRANGC